MYEVCDMDGYKSKKGILLYLGLLIITVGLFFAVSFLLFLLGAQTIYADITLWIVLSILVFLLFLLCLFQYLLLPRRLIHYDKQGIVIYSVFKRTIEIPFNQIMNIGLIAQPQRFLFASSTLVIVTKERGTYSVSFLQDFARIYQTINTLFNQFIVSAPDNYFNS
ncbi:MAG: hypothetical protein WC193_00770 [Bacilli bacterium]|jgi:hypothetical protein